MGVGEQMQILAGQSTGQWGLVTAAQAALDGVRSAELARLAKRNLIRRVRYGVYALPHSPADHLEEIRAEWLATDPSRTPIQRRNDDDPIVVSHDSAARIYGIGDMPTPAVHLTASRRIRPSVATVKTHRAQLHPREIEWIDGLPVTSLRRTLEDLSAGWELGHFQAAAEDALHRNLITDAQFTRSSILVAAVPELVRPARHNSVKQRLINLHQARATDAYDEFFRMQFLGILGQHPDWVLKGGTNLIFRLADARATQDLDLFRNRPDTADVTAQKLVRLMDGSKVGNYTFHVGDIRPSRENVGADTTRATVRVVDHTDNAPVNTFHIDVSAGVPLVSTPIRHTMSPSPAAIPGYPNRISIALYPIENQLADKLCAMYQDYGRGHSTRYHDLYDAAMIVDQLDFSPAILKEALRVQYERRNMVIPRDLPEPGPGWADTYNRVVPRLPGTRPPFTTYAEAMGAVRARIAPMLAELADEQ